MLVEEIDEAVKKLKVNEISKEPIYAEGYELYYIILRTE